MESLPRPNIWEMCVLPSERTHHDMCHIIPQVWPPCASSLPQNAQHLQVLCRRAAGQVHDRFAQKQVVPVVILTCQLIGPIIPSLFTHKVQFESMFHLVIVVLRLSCLLAKMVSSTSVLS